MCNLYYFCRLVEIDVHIPKNELDRLESNINIDIEDIFSMDVDDGGCIKVDPNKVEEEHFSDTLDICLKRIFIYMKTVCHNSNGSLL